METLAQTQETSQSALEKIMEQLKTASQETLEQVRTFFQSGSDTATDTETLEATEEAPAQEDTLLETTTTEPAAAEMTEEIALSTSNGTEDSLEAITETEVAETEEPTTEELQNEISNEVSEIAVIDALTSEEPKADIEIRLDEIYSIRVVAKEVVSSIEELQNEVAVLRTQVSSMYTDEQLEGKVKELVAAVLRERFV